jgi:hypothetical protein
MDKNARVQMQAMQMGDFTPLAPGELQRELVQPGRQWVASDQPPLPDRAWEALVSRVRR